MLVSFALESSNCTVNRSAKHNECGSIGVDLNGFKGPNTVGKDIYWGYITEDGSFEPFGKQNDYWDTYGSGGKAGCDLQKYSDAIGLTCAAQYLYQ